MIVRHSPVGIADHILENGNQGRLLPVGSFSSEHLLFHFAAIIPFGNIIHVFDQETVLCIAFYFPSCIIVIDSKQSHPETHRGEKIVYLIHQELPQD